MTDTPDPAGLWPPPNPPVDLPEPPATPVLLTVRVALAGTDPAVWRRVAIPGELDLGRMHDALQQVMGWEDSHLHRFSLGENPYAAPHFATDFDVMEDGDAGTPETEARLDQVLRKPGDTLTYEYDFGDSWTHAVTLEAVGPMPEPAAVGASEGADAGSAAYPLVCLAGERACPPEDVGGIPGYEEMAVWVRSGYDPVVLPDMGVTAEDLRGWLPDGWHPDHFDLDEVNAALARLAPRSTGVALAQLPRELVQVVTALPTSARFELDGWLAAPGWAEAATFTAEEAAALTAPLRIMLDAVGDGLTLTAAGYLPPRVVVALAADLGVDREWIGKLNREDQTWPVMRLREMARRVGLLRKAKGRLLPTAAARKVRDDPDALLAHALRRLVSGLPDFDRLATLLALVAVGGGEWGDRLSYRGPVVEVVCRVLAIRGWAREGYGALEPVDASRGFADTLGVLRGMVDSVGDQAREAELAARLARAALTSMS